MPIFEYQCLDCGRAFEFLQRSTGPKALCPTCGGEKLDQQISLCGVSSDTSQASHLSAAHAKAANRRSDKQRAEHAAHHDHFGDTPSGTEH